MPSTRRGKATNKEHHALSSGELLPGGLHFAGCLLHNLVSESCRLPTVVSEFLFIGDTTVAGVFYEPDVLRQRAAIRLVGRHPPLLSARAKIAI